MGNNLSQIIEHILELTTLLPGYGDHHPSTSSSIVHSSTAVLTSSTRTSTISITSSISPTSRATLSSSLLPSSSSFVPSSSSSTLVIITPTPTSSSSAYSSSSVSSSAAVSSSSLVSSSTSTSSLSFETSSSSLLSSILSTFSTSTISSSSSSASALPTSGFTCPADSPLSCSTTTAQDTCCYNYPGGQLLLTQFWDTNPSTGPNNSWTIHGLWPDHCDGTYDANCDASRAYTNITAILGSYGRTDLLSYMGIYWKDYQGNDESFYEHEWAKHGTCISTLEPSCYGSSYTPQEEVVDYFNRAIQLFKGLDSYTVLKNAGIVPSSSQTYTLDQISSALQAFFGYEVIVGCSSGALDELWYSYHVRGSVANGDFVPTSPDGSKSSCPSTGIKYLPKYASASGTATATSSAPSSSSTGAPFDGKGYLQAYPVSTGANNGCLISAGTWYTTGTCATYTAVPSLNGTVFTLKSSKGPCAIINNAISCASSNSYSNFAAAGDGTVLAYSGTSTFYAAATPTGSVQQTVYTTSNTVPVIFRWQGL